MLPGSFKISSCDGTQLLVGLQACSNLAALPQTRRRTRARFQAGKCVIEDRLDQVSDHQQQCKS